MSGSSSSAAVVASVVDALSHRGWCLGDLDHLKALIVEISSLLGGDGQARAVVDSVEAELLNMDIRFIGAKSLPDPIQLRRCSHLQGPKVLQISSVRDITRSSTEVFSGSSSGRRLLRLTLTDGQTQISALEYSHIPSIPDDVVPGTKVRLRDKAVVCNGLVCLAPKEVTVLGGVVQSLYEEWQMKKKYSAFARSSGRQSQENGAGSGPPPFEELRIGIGSHQHDYYKPASKSSIPTAAERAEKCSGAERAKTIEVNRDRKEPNKSLQRDPGPVDINPKTSDKEKAHEKPSSSETRPKQVVEAVPLQNQAAAQILLQKMKQPSSNEQKYRGRRYRGKGRQEEESEVFTLDEWEKRNVGAFPLKIDHPSDTSHDEDLAWQLQNQFDLEDSHGQEAHGTGADDIRVSMFNYERQDDNSGRGRARGRGRGRGRRRGRGRFS